MVIAEVEMAAVATFAHGGGSEGGDEMTVVMPVG